MQEEFLLTALLLLTATALCAGAALVLSLLDLKVQKPGQGDHLKKAKLLAGLLRDHPIEREFNKVFMTTSKGRETGSDQKGGLIGRNATGGAEGCFKSQPCTRRRHCSLRCFARWRRRGGDLAIWYAEANEWRQKTRHPLANSI